VSTPEGRLDVNSSIRGSVLNSCSSGQLELAGCVNAVMSLRGRQHAGNLLTG
jgi:hypothetical protein